MQLSSALVSGKIAFWSLSQVFNYGERKGSSSKNINMTVWYLESCRSNKTPSVRNVVSETIQLAKALTS